MTCCATEHSESAGIDGGYPGSSNGYVVHRDAGIAQKWAEGLLPNSPDEIGGTLEPQPAGAISRLAADDVCVLVTAGGGGFGDPLERDPSAVAMWRANLRKAFPWIKLPRLRLYSVGGLMSGEQLRTIVQNIDTSSKAEIGRLPRRSDAWLHHREVRNGHALHVKRAGCACGAK